MFKHSELGLNGPQEITNQNEGDSEAARREWLENMPLAVSVAEFCRLTSLGPTKAYELIAEGRIQVRKIGRRTLVLTKSIIALIEGDARGAPDSESAT